MVVWSAGCAVTAIASAPAALSASPGATAAPPARTGSVPPPSPDATASPASTTAAPAASSPGAATARLAAALPKSLSCDAPEAASGDKAELASVFCYVGDRTVGSVVYRIYPSLAALRDDYASWLAYYGIASGRTGSCAKGEP